MSFLKAIQHSEINSNQSRLFSLYFDTSNSKLNVNLTSWNWSNLLFLLWLCQTT